MAMMFKHIYIKYQATIFKCATLIPQNNVYNDMNAWEV